MCNKRSMSRFFVDKSQIGESEIHITNTGDIKHISQVLRLRAGDEVDISDSDEWEYRAEIRAIQAEDVVLKILDKQRFSREPNLNITLFQGIPKQGKMETIIQKSVEVGVGDVVPVYMSRTVVIDKGKNGTKQERWQRIADEAGKQCKRGIIPTVHMPMQFDDMVKNLKAFDLVLFPYENETGYTMKECLRHLEFEPENIAIIIGPEGGFSDSEAERIKTASGKAVSLGKTILRTETAGTVAIALTMYELEM